MREDRYWRLVAFLPVVIPAIVLILGSLAYVVFGIDLYGAVPLIPWTWVLLVLVGSVTFGLPPYLVLVGVLLLTLRRAGGERTIRRWLWVSPVLYLALFSAMWVALMQPVGPTAWEALAFYSAIAFSVACAYTCMAYVGSRVVAEGGRLQRPEAGDFS